MSRTPDGEYVQRALAAYGASRSIARAAGGLPVAHMLLGSRAKPGEITTVGIFPAITPSQEASIVEHGLYDMRDLLANYMKTVHPPNGRQHTEIDYAELAASLSGTAGLELEPRSFAYTVRDGLARSGVQVILDERVRLITPDQHLFEGNLVDLRA